MQQEKTDEDKQEIKEVTASVAAAVEISLDGAVVDVFITTGRHFPIKEEANGTERLFLVERDVPIQLWLEYC